jgi:hypothetical protein
LLRLVLATPQTCEDPPEQLVAPTTAAPASSADTTLDMESNVRRVPTMRSGKRDARRRETAKRCFRACRSGHFAFCGRGSRKIYGDAEEVSPAAE